MNDKTDWPKAHYEHDLKVEAKPAAAQEAVARQTMATCPRDGTVVLLHWGEDYVSPGWWNAPCAPVQNGDGTWPSDSGGFPWAFFDLRDGTAFVNRAVDTEYGPTHWSVYAAPVAAAPVVTAAEREWLQYAIDHMRDDNEPEDATCANVLEALLNRAESTPAAPGIDLQRLVPPEWLSEQIGGQFDDLTSGQAWRDGFNECRTRTLLLIEQARGLSLIDASPKGGHCTTCKDHGIVDAGHAADGSRDAVDCPDCSPKGGVDAVVWVNRCNRTVPEALRYLANHPRPVGGEARFNAAHLFQLADEIEHMASAPLYAVPMQATSAEVGE